MKILTVGDLHGKSVWQKIDPTNYDEIIFIGDLYDAFEYEFTTKEIHSNAITLVQWAKEAKNVKFCIGNHDAHYFKYGSPLFYKIRCGGFKSKQLFNAFNLYKDAEELFKVCYQHKNYLWSHAGFTQEGYNNIFKEKISRLISTKQASNFAEAVNILWDLNDPSVFYIPYSRMGDNLYGGPLWNDFKDTSADPLLDYHQIVGHTKVNDITFINKNTNTSITYIDCLDTTTKFFELTI